MPIFPDAHCRRRRPRRALAPRGLVPLASRRPAPGASGNASARGVAPVAPLRASRVSPTARARVATRAARARALAAATDGDAGTGARPRRRRDAGAGARRRRRPPTPTRAAAQAVGPRRREDRGVRVERCSSGNDRPGRRRPRGLLDALPRVQARSQRRVPGYHRRRRPESLRHVRRHRRQSGLGQGGDIPDEGSDPRPRMGVPKVPPRPLPRSSTTPPSSPPSPATARGGGAGGKESGVNAPEVVGRCNEVIRRCDSMDAARSPRFEMTNAGIEPTEATYVAVMLAARNNPSVGPGPGDRRVRARDRQRIRSVVANVRFGDGVRREI